jgi:CHAD domain-containing protein
MEEELDATAPHEISRATARDAPPWFRFLKLHAGFVLPREMLSQPVHWTNSIALAIVVAKMTRHKQSAESVMDDSSAMKIARSALRERFRNVVKFLARTVKSKCDHVEETHELRVATRRADAALCLFRDWLPSRHQRRVRDTLRKIRANAGAVRDLDLVRDRMLSASNPRLQRSSQWLLEQLAAERRSNRKTLLRRGRSAARDRLRDEMRRLVRTLRWRGTGDEPTSDQLAVQSVRSLTARFEEAWKSRDAGPKECHLARIRGRRVRYTLELLGSVFPQDAVISIGDRLQDVQDQLGRVNDAMTALRHLQAWLGGCRDASLRPALHAMVVRAESAATKQLVSLSGNDGLRNNAEGLFAELQELQPMLDGAQAVRP